MLQHCVLLAECEHCVALAEYECCNTVKSWLNVNISEEHAASMFSVQVNGVRIVIGFLWNYVNCVGRDSIVGIDSLRAGRSGDRIPVGGRDFWHLFRPALWPTQPPVQWVPSHYWGGGGTVARVWH
jgi:hypothetical protein